jgi:hypothetical protein
MRNQDQGPCGCGSQDTELRTTTWLQQASAQDVKPGSGSMWLRLARHWGGRRTTAWLQQTGYNKQAQWVYDWIRVSVGDELLLGCNKQARQMRNQDQGPCGCGSQGTELRTTAWLQQTSAPGVKPGSGSLWLRLAGHWDCGLLHS